MHGDGTKLGTTRNNPPAFLLDLTRLISRTGRPLTGVDRVEFAYLRYLLSRPEDAYGLVRTTLGYVLLNSSGLRELYSRIAGEADWGAPDALSLTARKKGVAVRRAESDLRRFALARSLPRGVGRMLAHHVPEGVEYLNVGHANLNDRTLWAVRHSLKARIAVFVHDTIPLDYPQYQRPGSSETFRAKLKRVQHYADRVICNSAYTRERMTEHMSAWGNVPEAVVAPLGIDLVEPDPKALPRSLDLSRPYFVAVGTIEPRKRHDLILDAWEDLIADLEPDAVPNLFICGARGWNNDAVFSRLDALPEGGPVRELNGLSDGAISALLAGARALVFASDVEGYGLPPIEAALRGTPVICQDLPVYRETLGDIPVYLTTPDRYLLSNLVQSLLNRPEVEQEKRSRQRLVAPRWQDHFSLVFGD